jgi:hypothetical protein
MFEHAAKLNWEGIVSKRADAPYRSERTEAWQKIKTVQKGKFPVIGFVKDPTGVAALYLGKRDGKELVYMGKVGTGWSRTVSSQIRKQLDTVVSPKSKLTRPVSGRISASQHPVAGTQRREAYPYSIESRDRCLSSTVSSTARVMIGPNCKICFGLGWVCENHRKRVWDERGCE